MAENVSDGNCIAPIEAVSQLGVLTGGSIMQISTIALLFSLWAVLATIVALGLGVVLGNLPAAPKPAPVPIRTRRAEDVMAESDLYEVCCGACR